MVRIFLPFMYLHSISIKQRTALGNNTAGRFFFMYIHTLHWLYVLKYRLLSTNMFNNRNQFYNHVKHNEVWKYLSKIFFLVQNWDFVRQFHLLIRVYWHKLTNFYIHPTLRFLCPTTSVTQGGCMDVYYV